MAEIDAPLPLERLRALVDSRDVDTVVVGFTDVQGRLQGSRVHARHFVDEVLKRGLEVGDYLLAVDVDMAPVAGYAMTSWDTGLGDLVLRPDLSTLRPVTWLPSSALVLCDLVRPDGSPVEQSPRQVLLRQMALAAEAGLEVLAGSELEFLLFEDTYEQAWDADYQGLTPVGRYSGAQSLLATSKVEPLMRELRTAMQAAGMSVESSQGKRGVGQHEITFRPEEAVVTADQHVIFKAAAKEIAAKHGRSATFMATYDEKLEGNGCHLTLNLRRLRDGAPVFVDDRGGRSAEFDHFLAGVLQTMRDFSLLYAPNVNSYKRFQQPGRFAPVNVGWGEDNRSCAVRVIGGGEGLRMQNRVPGADVNPYLALAAMIAGGLHGLKYRLPNDPPISGNAYLAGNTRLPSDLRDARNLFASSQTAVDAFGQDVVSHYVHAADVELEAFEGQVTAWERRRGFERL